MPPLFQRLTEHAHIEEAGRGAPLMNKADYILSVTSVAADEPTSQLTGRQQERREQGWFAQ